VRHNLIWRLSVAMGGTSAASHSEQVHPQLLPGDRMLIGTVVEVRSVRHGLILGKSCRALFQLKCESQGVAGLENRRRSRNHSQ
jgi:hypothetical protein